MFVLSLTQLLSQDVYGKRDRGTVGGGRGEQGVDMDLKIVQTRRQKEKRQKKTHTKKRRS